jgi:hypothetical protein
MVIHISNPVCRVEKFSTEFEAFSFFQSYESFVEFMNR